MFDQFPMSPQQRSTWLAGREGGRFLAQARLRLRGRLDPAVLRAAFDLVVERHESLRTTFERAAWMKVPEQAVRPAAEPAFRTVPLSGLAGAAQEEAIERLAAEELDRPCELGEVPLVSAALVSLRSDDHLLLLTLPALLADLHSLGELAVELGRAYAHLVTGEELPEDPPLQYVDFASWQSEFLESDEAREEQPLVRAYWAGRRLPELQSVRLPFAGAGIGGASFKSAAVPIPVDARLAGAMAQLQAESGISPAAVFAAGWQAYLGRLAGEAEVALGAVLAGRKLEQLESGLGLYARLLPLRAPLAGDLTGRELCQRMEAELAEADRWQEHGVPEEVAGLPAEAIRFPFQIEIGRRPPARLSAGVSFELVSCRSDIAPFQLKLACTLETDGGLAAELHYDESRLARPVALLHAERLASWFAQLCQNPESPLSALDVASPAERRRLVVDWNATAADFPGGCFHHLFEEQARRAPERIAVAGEGEALAYGELDARANRLARRLRTLGVGPEVRVAIFAERSPRFLVALLAVLKAGGAYVPLDPALPADRLRGMLADSAAAVLLTESALAGRLPESLPVLLLDLLEAADGAPEGDESEAPAVAVEVGEENLMYVLFTSGSTGRPKGVAVEHRQALNYLHAVLDRLELPAGGSYATVSTFAADLGNTMVFPALATGGCLRIVSHERASDPAALAEDCDRHPIDCLKIVPSHLAALLAADEADRLLPRQRLVIGGEAASPDLLARLGALAERGLAVYNHYGPTETTVGVAARRLEPGWAGERLPLGRPLANVRLYLLDATHRPVAAGLPGELHVGGANLARGYLGRPEATAERFLPDAWSGVPGARLYRTGDLARFNADSEIEFVGRVDHQVKIRGYRIELGEIEAALAARPGVREAAVLAVADPGRGGDRRLAAFFVADGSPAPTAEALRGALAKALPEYMVPPAILRLDAMPRNANGKLDRAALAELAARRATADGDAADGEAPRTRNEEILARIWCDLLRLERVGRNDNFFERGGDSILSIQVISRAAREGLRIAPRQIFDHPTIAGLAAAAEAASETAVEEAPATGDFALTPIEERFFAQSLPRPEHFNQAILLEIAEPGGQLDYPALLGALRHLVAEHAALRLRFTRTAEGRLRQSPAPAGVPGLQVDLSALSEEAGRQALTAAATAVQESLDLDSGLLFRAVLFRLAESPERLLLVAHHLGVDGVSWRILLDDLETAYRQLAAGGSVILPPRTASYRAWSERLSALAAAPETEMAGRAWLAASGERPPRLPVDALTGPNDVASSRSVAVALDPETTRALLQEVPRVYHTQVNDALVTALAQAISGWSGERRVFLDLEGHGRGELSAVDLSRTVGWFTVYTPLLLQLEEGPGGEALPAVKEQLRAAPRGFAQGLLRHLGEGDTADALRSQPIPEIVFNYLGQLDPVVAPGRLFRPAALPIGPSRAPEQPRERLLEAAAHVSGGELRLTLVYSRNRHRRETIEELARRFLAALRAIVAHCAAPGAGGYTPSDFPLARLDRRSLAALAALAGPGLADVYPLSPLQAGLLFHSLHSTREGLYLGQMSLTLEVALDEGAFERAWQELVRRHAILRTGFWWRGAERPLQVVQADVALPWTRRDWRGLAPAEQRERLAEFLAADRRRSFDPTVAPLLRFALLRLGEESFHFVWTRHHVLLDGWSLPLLFSELFALYSAAARGETLSLPPARPYRDFIAWLERQDRGAAEAYWRRALAGFRAATPLPGSSGSTRTAGPAFGSRVVRLAPAASERLAAFARAQQVTQNIVVDGAWALLLSRYSGEEDVVFGAVTAGRSAPVPGIEEMLGLFINTLPARVRVAPAALPGAWLRGLQAEQAEMRQFEWSSLVDVQGWSELPRGQALFESILAFENYPVDESLAERADTGLRVSGVASHELPHYPVSLAVAPGPSLRVSLDYDARRLDAAEVERLLSHFTTLLGAFAESGEADLVRPLAELSLLPEGERAQILYEWGEAGEAAPFRPVHEEALEQARLRPGAVAVASAAGVLTYGELAAAARGLARELRSLGVGPEVRVALLASGGAERAVGALAVLSAGGAYVSLDPGAPDERLAFQLADSGAPVILAEPPVAEHLAGRGAAVLTLDLPRIAELAAAGTEPLPSTAIGPESLAYIIYTSGSTGKPKGVEIPHQGLANLVRWHRETWGVRAEDCATLLLNPGFDGSVWELWPYLASGAALHVPEPELRLAPEALVGWLERQAITLTLLPTPVAEAVLELPESAAQLEKLRILLIGGDRLHRGPEARHPFRVANNYGPTEYSVVTTAEFLAPAEPEAAGEPALPSIGRPILGTRVRVFGPDRELAPAGVPGELQVGGVGLARGYLGRPDLTAELFVPDPTASSPGERLYRTGDLVRWLGDGRLDFLGRIDHQVKIRGFRIELGEIEAVLGACPGVFAAAVLVRDEPAGPRLVAYLAGEGLDAHAGDTLRARLATTLPGYMLPADFVLLPALPLTPNGKVDRRALAAESAGDPGKSAGTGAPPQTPLEELLAGIFAEVLKVDRPCREDSFFGLGGHSLLAMQVVSRVRALGFDLPVRDLFEAPSIADLARRLGGAGGVTAIERVPRDGALPLSFGQERLWVLDQLAPGNAAYNIRSAFLLRGELHLPALTASFSLVVRRHEVLRTRFVATPAGPLQIVDPPAPQPLAFLDLSALPAAEADAAGRRFAENDARQPFDLAQGPLFRAAVLRLSADRHAVVATFHHTVSDGASMGLLLGELAAAYGAAVAGRAPSLPPLPIQYADYAAWQRRRLQGDVLTAELAHWRERLRDLPPALSLPTDRPRRALQSFRGESESLRLSPALSGALRALSRQHGATLFMTLLAGFDLLLSRQSGQEDLLVGTPISGRDRPELEPLLGFFLNTLVLRVDLAGDPTFAELLGRVRETALDAYAHQELPFEKLLAELQPERNLARTPLFQVFFNLLNPPAAAPALPGLTLESIPLGESQAKFDLTLYAADLPDGIGCHLVYSADLFDRSRIRVLLDQLAAILAQVAAAPGERIGRVSLVTEPTRAVLPDPTAALEAPARPGLARLFWNAAEEHPEAPAVRQGERSWSYGELRRRATGVAASLAEGGLAPGEVVAVTGERSPELLAAALGVALAGGVLLLLDRKLPAARRRTMLAEAAVRRLLIAGAATADEAGLAESLLELPIGAAMLPTPAGFAPCLAPDPDGPAYVVFTSGTTGVPKGILGRQKGLGHFLAWQRERFAVGPGDRVAQLTGLSFDVVLRDLFLPLVSGACLHLPEGEDLAADAVLPWLEREGITLLHTVPSLASLWVDRTPEGVGLARLRWVFFAGEPLADLLVNRWRRAFPASPAGGGLANFYGPSETTLAKLYSIVPDPAPPGTQPIGRPLPETQALVLSAAGEPCGLFEPGEIAIRTPFRSLGYLGAPEETRRRFRANPWRDDPGDLLYRTGDRGRCRADGSLEILGRLDDQVKIRGMRVEPDEVRAALSTHPAVAACAVVARAGAGGLRLVAYVVPAPGSAVSPEELPRHLRERLPDYMVPAAYVSLTALPLTPNGKLDRRALPAPEGGAPAGRPRVAPRDETELALAEIWQELLEIAAVGVHDNFFALGGHSLLALRLQARLHERFGRRLAAAEIFRGPTIAELAERLADAAPAAPGSPLVLLRAGAAAPPFFCVHPAGGRVAAYQALSDAGTGDHPFYGLEARGHEPGETPDETVLAMAERYLAAVRELQPSGPYLLGGWSFGGRVAFEMARRLEAVGERVAALVLFDSAAPAAGEAGEEADLAFALAFFARRAGLAVEAEELAALAPAARTAHVARLAAAAGLLGESEASALIDRGLAVFRAHTRAAVRYRPEPYAGPLVYLRAAEQGPAASEKAPGADPARGWSRLCRRPITVHTVPGDHMSLLRPPHVATLSQVLAGVLAEALA